MTNKLFSLALLVFLVVLAAPAAAETVEVRIGTNLPEGMRVYVAVGGDGCNCTAGGTSVVVGSGGSVTVSLEIECETSRRPAPPNAKCRVYARGLDEKSDKSYRGQGTLTATSTSGVYQSTFRMSVVP